VPPNLQLRLLRRGLSPLDHIYWRPPRIRRRRIALNRARKVDLPLLQERLHALLVVAAGEHGVDDARVEQVRLLSGGRAAPHHVAHERPADARAVVGVLGGELQRAGKDLVGPVGQLGEQPVVQPVRGRVRRARRHQVHCPAQPHQPWQEER